MHQIWNWRNLLKTDRFWAGRLNVQNQCFCNRNLLKTDRFWAGRPSVQNQCFSNRNLLKTDRFWAGRLNIQNQCSSNRNLFKTNRFWAGRLTVQLTQLTFDPLRILKETYWFWREAKDSRGNVCFLRGALCKVNKPACVNKTFLEHFLMNMHASNWILKGMHRFSTLSLQAQNCFIFNTMLIAKREFYTIVSPIQIWFVFNRKALIPDSNTSGWDLVHFQ